MKICKRAFPSGKGMTSVRTSGRLGSRGRGKKVRRANLGASMARVATQERKTSAKIGTTEQLPSVGILRRSPRILELFSTGTGLDITPRVIDLFWLASEQGYLTVQAIQKAFAEGEVTPVEMASIRRMLGQAGVEVVDAAIEESAQTKSQPASDESAALTPGTALQPLRDDAGQAGLDRMQTADLEMRQILYTHGFAAREHAARAEKLLAHPSEAKVKDLITEPDPVGRRRFLRGLPALVHHVRELDRRADLAYRGWREATSVSQRDDRRAEFRRLDRELQETLPRFAYRTRVIQEMTATAQNIAARIEASHRVVRHAQQHGDSVSHLPLLDVERQTIASLEEFMRMPSEVFLRSCSRLAVVEAGFQEARTGLAQQFFHLVASAARQHSNQGLTIPELIREGIAGLARAIERARYQHGCDLPASAAAVIREEILSALARHAGRSQRRRAAVKAPKGPDTQAGTGGAD